MISLKRVSIFFVAGLVVSMLVFLVSTFSEDQNSAKVNLKVKVLRRKDQGHLKPTQTEVAIAKGQSKEERSLEDKIPKHLPIKVKIKADKEKGFKDLDNPGWARDFELEVTNTGTRPIYRLVLLLHLPETAINGGPACVFPDLRAERTHDVPGHPREREARRRPDWAGSYLHFKNSCRREGLGTPSVGKGLASAEKALDQIRGAKLWRWHRVPLG